MSRRLLVIRHGNTFEPGQTPTRVGSGTDLPLVEESRSRAIGRYLKKYNIIPDRIIASPLRRTMQTGALIAEELDIPEKVEQDHRFIEIDYGPDENQTEERVIQRLGDSYALENGLSGITEEQRREYGTRAIEQWNRNGTVPEGWKVDTDKIISTWREIAEGISENQTLAVCTSNGIIRFSPEILPGGISKFSEDHDIKVATGSISIFENEGDGWSCVVWNEIPVKKGYLSE